MAHVMIAVTSAGPKKAEIQQFRLAFTHVHHIHDESFAFTLMMVPRLLTYYFDASVAMSSVDWAATKKHICTSGGTCMLGAQ